MAGKQKNSQVERLRPVCWCVRTVWELAVCVTVAEPMQRVTKDQIRDLVTSKEQMIPFG